jgi:predicted enzyme related to lactoylglutathione lyase
MVAPREAGGEPTMPQETKHVVQHFEIVSTEPKRMQKFLEDQFGWTFESHPMPEGGEYLMFRMPDGNGGGVTPPMDPSQPIAVTPYINVADIQRKLAECEKAGAKILMPVTDVEGMGKFFWFQVAGGPPLACWQDTAPS